jgi:DNA helicase-2/ATP-dependent DNA helicase PcrA
MIGGVAGIADLSKYAEVWNQEYPEMAITAGDRDLDEDNGSPNEGDAQGDAAYNAMNIYRARMIDPERWPAAIHAFYKSWTDWKQASGLIDFTDMLELALAYQDGAPGNPDVIFADESQDFSKLEMSLLLKWGESAGQLVVVGDPYQSLYHWRGADPDIFFMGSTSESHKRVLEQSYRVPVAAHNAAMSFIEAMPGYQPIQYYPTKEYGSYEHLSASIKEPEKLLPVIQESLDNDQSVMILASCSYMLTGVIRELRQAGIPFHNPYRVKNGAWNPLSRRGIGVSSTDRLIAFLRLGQEGFWTKRDLQTWLSGAKCSDVLPSKTSYQKFEKGPLAAVADGELPYDLLEILVGKDAVEASMAADFDYYQNSLQAAKQPPAAYPCAIARRSGVDALAQKPQVTVGTIHSVKGGEADTVIVAPDLSARGVESYLQDEAGKAAIYRLFYVAMTRAKQNLYTLNPTTSKMAMRLP